MLWNTSMVRGYAVEAHDGPLGEICDLFFCGADWRIRWLVVEGNDWLSRRKVLVHPSALQRVVRELRHFPAALSTHQVKQSPVVDTGARISRKVEVGLYDHYGCDPAWGDGKRRSRRTNASHHDLLSVNAATGFGLCATDGDIGHVQDFIVDDSDWAVRHVVADTQTWWPGQMVLIAPSAMGMVNGDNGTMHLQVDRKKIKDSPVYGSCRIVDQKFEDVISGGEARASL